MKQHGLKVDSCDGSFHLTDVNAYLHTEDMPKCDVVLVCLKSTTKYETFGCFGMGVAFDGVYIKIKQ